MEALIGLGALAVIAALGVLVFAMGVTARRSDDALSEIMAREREKRGIAQREEP